jgi:xanthine dehydrogenase accessory factor
MNPDPPLDPWTALGRWAEQRRRPLVVTLTEAPSEEAGLVGRIAVLENAGAAPRGPLAEAPFWPADWEFLRKSAAELPPEWGRLATMPSGRRYLISSLVYNRSALVLGGGHVGGALTRLLRFLEFEVTLVDDRPEFLQSRDDGALAVEAPFSRLTELFAGSNVDAAALVTRSHAEDTACLRQILRWPAVPPYLGMIGSRRRTRGTLDLLAGEGISPDLLQRVHTPIGLAIGAQTPEEIAVAIAGEIIQVLRDQG